MTTPTARTTWHLAILADCADPDRHDGIGYDPDAGTANPSPGAKFLRSVETATYEAIDHAGEDFDPDNFDTHEIADGAVPVYTSERWAVFVDLAAWQEDPDGLDAGGDMTDRAGVYLYMIAERLASAIVAERAADDEGEE